MYKPLGIIMFSVGSLGLLLQQFFAQQQRTDFLQEMNQSLLRLHREITKRNLPIGIVLKHEISQCRGILAQYYDTILSLLKRNTESQVFLLFYAQIPTEMKRLTKEEERRLWVQALCSLFLVESPGEDANFFAYYEGFADMLKKDYSTKKEREKVTACTTGMGLLLLLILLL